jgi:hypothetical protein
MTFLDEDTCALIFICALLMLMIVILCTIGKMIADTIMYLIDVLIAGITHEYGIYKDFKSARKAMRRYYFSWFYDIKDKL